METEKSVKSSIVHELVHKQIFFAQAQLIYQTSQKLRLKIGLFINKQTWMSFYRVEPELFTVGFVHLQATSLSLSFLFLSQVFGFWDR